MGRRRTGQAVIPEVIMSVGAIVALVIILVLLVAAALAGTVILRRRALRRRFGAEYDRLAREVGPRRASAELAERERLARELDLRPLSAEKQAAYGKQWAAAQERFVDSPAQAVTSAADLVTAVAADRGYSVSDPERFPADLSVYHAPRLDGYKHARRITGQAATAATEDLRQALLEYRAMFLELVRSPDNAADRGAVPADADVDAGTGTGVDAGTGTGGATAGDAVAGGGDDRATAQPATSKG
jgi:hypothetical protein